MSTIDTTSGNSAPRQSDPSQSGSHTSDDRSDVHRSSEESSHLHTSDHSDDHSHDGSHDHSHDEHDHGRSRERKKKGPSEDPQNLSEQLVAGTLRGRRSKCSHGCGSDGGCSTGGCGVSSLVEMIANKFDYTDTRQIIEVTFPGYRRGFVALDKEVPLRVRDTVVVQSPNGTDWGTVSMTGSLVHAKRKAKRLSNEELPELLRKADENDLKRIEQCKVSERHAFSVCRTRVESFNLPMILVGAEWQFDHKKLTFFFTADGRVDFRELVRDLAAIFNTRIELRQIPVRDAAKRIGGMGVCGLELCCTTHLGRYEHITLDHAKIQQIPANPSKLSGQCGRLKCCLLYEVDTYVEGLKRFPPLESTITTDVGVGVIQKIDLFRDLIHLYHTATSGWETLTLEEYRDIMAGKRKKKEPEPVPAKPAEPIAKANSSKGEKKKEEMRGEKKEGKDMVGKSGGRGNTEQGRPAEKKATPGEKKGEGRREEKRGQRREGGGSNETKPEGTAPNPNRAAPSGQGGQNDAEKRRRKKKKGGPRRDGPPQSGGQSGGGRPQQGGTQQQARTDGNGQAGG